MTTRGTPALQVSPVPAFCVINLKLKVPKQCRPEPAFSGDQQQWTYDRYATGAMAQVRSGVWWCHGVACS